MSTSEVSRPWIERNGPKTALAAAAILTFVGEFELAALAHYPLLLAVFFPIAIDVYAFTAFHVGRRVDVTVSVLLMLIAQIASHLAKAGLIPLTGVSGIVFMVVVVSIPPIVAYRAHQIIKPEIPKVDPEPEPVVVQEHDAVPAPVKGRRSQQKVKRSKAETAALVRSFMCEHPNASQAAAARALNLSEKWVSECLKLNQAGAGA